MPKTNWKDPKTSEILSTHISGLQEAVRKIEETLDLAVASETDILLEEVFISIDDRYRVYQAPEGKRNWLLSPAPVIKKNGNVITDDFEIDYGGGGIIFTTPAEDGDILTADATIVINESLLLAKIFGTEIEIGQDASTFGADAIAIGKQALANDDNSVSIGNGSVALDADSVAIGAGSKANNQRTIAIGNNAEADNIDGMALGYGAYAFHQRAAAIGKNAKTYSSDEISIGSDEEPKRMRVSGAPVNENDAVRKKELDEHKADYVRQPGYGTTAGSANTYTLTLNPALVSYVAGVCVAVKVHAANTGASTININGLGVKGIRDSKGNALTSGKLVLNGVYTMRYDGTNFILQGEGGSGNALASDLLSGKTASVDAGDIVGTMPNRGSVGTQTITTQNGEYVIPAGYHNGAGKARASFANLVEGNIKNGINVGGVVGNFKGDLLFPLFFTGDAANSLSFSQQYVSQQGVFSKNVSLLECSFGSGYGNATGATDVLVDFTGFNSLNIEWYWDIAAGGTRSGFTEAYLIVHSLQMADENNWTRRLAISGPNWGSVSKRHDVLDVSTLTGLHYVRIQARTGAIADRFYLRTRKLFLTK